MQENQWVDAGEQERRLNHRSLPPDVGELIGLNHFENNLLHKHGMLLFPPVYHKRPPRGGGGTLKNFRYPGSIKMKKKLDPIGSKVL